MIHSDGQLLCHILYAIWSRSFSLSVRLEQSLVLQNAIRYRKFALEVLDQNNENWRIPRITVFCFSWDSVISFCHVPTPISNFVSVSRVLTSRTLKCSSLWCSYLKYVFFLIIWPSSGSWIRLTHHKEDQSAPKMSRRHLKLKKRSTVQVEFLSI